MAVKLKGETARTKPSRARYSTRLEVENVSTSALQRINRPTSKHRGRSWAVAEHRGLPHISRQIARNLRTAKPIRCANR